MGPLPKTAAGNRYIVTLMDYFSKWPEAEPLTDKSAHGVASFLFRMICILFLEKGLQFSFLLTDMTLLVASSVIKGGSLLII